MKINKCLGACDSVNCPVGWSLACTASTSVASLRGSTYRQRFMALLNLEQNPPITKTIYTLSVNKYICRINKCTWSACIIVHQKYKQAIGPLYDHSTGGIFFKKNTRTFLPLPRLASSARYCHPVEERWTVRSLGGSYPMRVYMTHA